MHSRSGAVIEEASLSQAPSHTAPAKKSSCKSVGGNALRLLSGATQVGQCFHALNLLGKQMETPFFPSCMFHNVQIWVVCLPGLLGHFLKIC